MKDKIDTKYKDYLAISAKVLFTHMMMRFMWSFIPVIMTPTTLSTYRYLGNTLELAQTMQIILLLEKMAHPIWWMSNVRNQVSDLQLNFTRIQRYLMQDEVDRTDIITVKKDN